MLSTSIAEFESALTDLGMTRIRTTIRTFEDDLRTVLREPVVSASIPNKGISFGDLPVTTHLTPKQLDAANTGVTAAEFAVAPYVIAHDPGDQIHS